MNRGKLFGKTVILTGGGTAGHITPNFSLLGTLHDQGAAVVYIGLKGGMEEGLVAEVGLPFYGIRGGKLRRNFSWRNLTDIGRIAQGFFQSLVLLRRLKPHVVFSKGGFVTTPVVWAAWCLGIPIVLHESDLTPGLANKLAMPFAKKVGYAFKETSDYLPKQKAVYTGLPVRPELFTGSRDVALLRTGLSGKRPVLLITGGSQGARSINRLVQTNLEALLQHFDLCHLVGKDNINTELLDRPGYCQLEFVTSGMADLYAAADYVISRAGATTIFELLALKKPHLLIPLGSRATRGDQILNAQSFERLGYSLVLEDTPEADLSGALKQLVAQADQLRAAMEKGASSGGASVVTLIAQVAK